MPPMSRRAGTYLDLAFLGDRNYGVSSAGEVAGARFAEGGESQKYFKMLLKKTCVVYYNREVRTIPFSKQVDVVDDRENLASCTRE